MMEGADFKGVIDLIRMKAIVWDTESKGETFNVVDIPLSFLDHAQTARDFMIENAAEQDETLLEYYLENDSLDEKQIILGLRQGTISNKIVPILCGSALKNQGVQPVIDAIIDFLPSPVDIPPIRGLNPETGSEELRNPRTKEPLCALAFKVIMDKVGRRFLFEFTSESMRKAKFTTLLGVLKRGWLDCF